jgi:hypothetical protein
MVDLGPFKQKVDDGLPLRKTALAALGTILDVAPEHVDMATLAPPLGAALDDVADVQQICHQVVVKVAASPLHQSGVRASLDLLADPLRTLLDKTLKSIAKKLKEGTGGPELERQNDLVNSITPPLPHDVSVPDFLTTGLKHARWTKLSRISALFDRKTCKFPTLISTFTLLPSIAPFSRSLVHQVRSALRAYLALDAAADEDAAAAAPKFRGLKEVVAANERLRATVEQIQTEG